MTLESLMTIFRKDGEFPVSYKKRMRVVRFIILLVFIVLEINCFSQNDIINRGSALSKNIVLTVNNPFFCLLKDSLSWSSLSLSKCSEYSPSEGTLDFLKGKKLQIDSVYIFDRSILYNHDFYSMLGIIKIKKEVWTLDLFLNYFGQVIHYNITDENNQSVYCPRIIGR